MRRMLPVMMLFMLFGLTACETMAPKPEVLPAGVQLNAKYYTQVTMQYEKASTVLPTIDVVLCWRSIQK